MRTTIRRVPLVFAAVASLFLPALGAYFRWGGWPPGFGVFPPQTPHDSAGAPIEVPGFSPLYFGIASLVAGLLFALLLVPGWFGFARATGSPRRAHARTRFPWWMWLGALLNVTCWGMMWFSQAAVVKYLFTPLWWGFILVVDGVVYARTGGASLLAKRPRQLAALTVMSVVGWYFFEWLNFFLLENWTYPNSPAIFSDAQAYFWFGMTYTCVWPIVFEWYTLLRTFPSLRRRWASGPTLAARTTWRWTALLLGVALGVLVGIFPHGLFFTVWLASLLILPATLSLLGHWTPFKPIARGDWTQVMLIALSSLVSGFFWEFWNYGSNLFIPGRNPNYWVYDLPYVDVLHLFSEMPLIGYVGYLPFGLQCWAWWLIAANLFQFNPDLELEALTLSHQPADATSMLPAE